MAANCIFVGIASAALHLLTGNSNNRQERPRESSTRPTRGATPTPLETKAQDPPMRKARSSKRLWVWHLRTTICTRIFRYPLEKTLTLKFLFEIKNIFKPTMRKETCQIILIGLGNKTFTHRVEYKDRDLNNEINFKKSDFFIKLCFYCIMILYTNTMETYIPKTIYGRKITYVYILPTIIIKLLILTT